jgi:hypothetical protein
MNASADKEECSQLEIDPSNTAEVQSDLSSVLEAETLEEEEDNGSSKENDSSSKQTSVDSGSLNTSGAVY